MAEQDTIRLLRECDAGIKMGVASINQVLEYLSDSELKQLLRTCRDEHESIQRDLQNLLQNYHDDGKEPNPMAKSMSWMKTNVKLVINESDQTIADLITDGCNMGVKSINKYLNHYANANEKAKSLARKISDLEEHLTINIRKYL